MKVNYVWVAFESPDVALQAILLACFGKVLEKRKFYREVIGQTFKFDIIF